MPSFSIPNYPRFEFPAFQNSMDWDELAPLCNDVYDRFKKYLDEPRNSRTYEMLVAGNHGARIKALHQLKEHYQTEHRAKVERYYRDLQTAIDAASSAPAAALIHRHLQEALAVKASASMTDKQRKVVKLALEAVRNIEASREQRSPTTAVGEALKEAQERAGQNGTTNGGSTGDQIAEETPAAA